MAYFLSLILCQQPQGHVQLLLQLIVARNDAQTAVDAPRLCIEDGTAGGRIAIEAGTRPAVVAALREMGHDVRVLSGHDRAMFGRAQIIMRDRETGVLTGGSDGRADGCAIGY